MSAAVPSGAQAAPKFEAIQLAYGEKHHAQLMTAEGGLLTVQARVMGAVSLLHAAGGAGSSLRIEPAEAAALAEQLRIAAGQDEPAGPYWFHSAVGMDTPCIVEYEPTPDGACLNRCYVNGAVLDAHADADVFTAYNTRRWQEQADAHLRELTREARDDVLEERAQYEALRAA